MGKTSSFKADSLSITPQIPEIEADTVTCNPLRTHLLGFPYEKKKKKTTERIQRKGRTGAAPNVLGHISSALQKGLEAKAVNDGGSGAAGTLKGSAFLSGVMNGVRGHRG